MPMIMISTLRTIVSPRWATLLVLSWAGIGIWVGSVHAEPQFDRDVLPFLEQNCFRCHGKEKQKGNFRLDNLSRDFTNGSSVAHWLEVVDRVGSGEMPPESQPNRPGAEESGRIVEWLVERINEGDAERLARTEPVSLRRLTRQEYVNTIYDLLGVIFDATDPAGLNEDDSWNGFERIGSVLSLSASHVEKYLTAAEMILDEAYPEVPPKPFLIANSAVDLVGGPKTYGKERYEELHRSGLVNRIRIDLWPGQSVRAQPVKTWVEFAGVYRFRAKLSGLRPAGGPAPHLSIRADSIDRILFERDVLASEADPTTMEFEVHLPAGHHEFTLTNDVPGPLILTRFGRSGSKPFFSLKEGRIPWQIQLKDEKDVPLFPVLILDSFEWEGPIPLEGKQESSAFMPDEDGGMDQVHAGLEEFAERAFRRPLETGELERYVQIVQAEIAAGSKLIPAVKTAMLGILCSKSFLYLVEGAPGLSTSTLSDWELASRLSYFLWSTMPDDELLGLDRKGTLQSPKVLRSQVERMLRDSRIERLVDAFATQWLQLKRVGMFTPDAELYPTYDRYLEKSMVRETTEFFGEVLDKNLTLREFLVSDWTMLNPRLALHYGIPGITEDRFRRVSLKPDYHRGGLLTHASVLSLTSDGTRHRPVHRGVWIAESIFGKSPPPPPASVEPIEPIPFDGEKASIRMQLKAHRSDPSCASCHRKIDPLGFAFDNYDAIGQWRAEEVVPVGVGSNPKVDASGVLPDGRRFANAGEFKDLLLEDIDTFNEAFVKALATFALRRTMTFQDRNSLEKITSLSRSSDYRLRDVIEAIVLSDLFKQR